MTYPVKPRLYEPHHLSFAGVVDEAGRELTHAHLREALHSILGLPLIKLIGHLGPEHPDTLEAFHARVKGVWTIDRYDAPIEFYAAKLIEGVTEDMLAADALWPQRHPAAFKAAMDKLQRDHKSDSSQFSEELEFHNVFTTNGINLLWTGITQSSVGSANSGASPANTNAIFNATQSRIGVGDSTTGALASQTDLQAATNKYWQVVSGAPSVSTNQISFTSSFGSSNGNFAWQEFAVDNNGGSNSTATGARSGGTMLDRVVSAQGTKAVGQTWNPTMTLSIT